MNAITTRRTLARQPAAPPAIRQTIDVVPPVAGTVADAPPPPHQPLISTELLERIVAFLVGAFVGAWLMGMAG
jgi:hypothetical protein